MRALLLVALLAGCTASEPESTGRNLHPDRLRADVGLLASDDFLGRGTGEKGADLAADHLAQAFTEAGLRPLPGQDALKIPYTLYRQGYDPSGTALELELGDARPTTALGLQFRPFPFSDAGDVRGELVFAGYGITAPELDWDDYADLDVTGKIVVLFRHDPGEGQADSPWAEHGGHALFTSKAQNALEHGAVGMILTTDPLHHEGSDDLRADGRLRLEPPDERAPQPRRRSAERADDDEAPFLAVQVDPATAASLVAPLGRDLAALQTALNAGEAVNGPIPDAAARLAVAPREQPEQIHPVNVLGFLEGSDPALRDEWVVVGAHYDHLGAFAGHGDTIYNGADDNASGTAGMLALARAWSELTGAHRPKRSMVFAGFSGEEKGLLGSRALVEDGLLSRDNVVFMLNLDMIGRDNGPVEVVGDGYATGLGPVVEAANASLALPIELGGTDYTGNSDHHPFFEADIPFLFFFTGLHDDYHQLSDHAEKLDVDRMAKIVRLGMDTLRPVVSGELTPRFVHHITWLGVTVQRDDTTGRAVITAVEAGSRAAEAGLATGDAIHGFDDAALDDPRRVGEHFRAIEPGASARIAVDRANSRLSFTVERAKTGYLGVWPAPLTDEFRARHGLSEDDGLLLREVMADTPAAAAGLLDGDAIIAVHGVPVGMRTLSKVLTRIGAGETVPVTVIREDVRQTLTITLGERPERP